MTQIDSLPAAFSSPVAVRGPEGPGRWLPDTPTCPGPNWERGAQSAPAPSPFLTVDKELGETATIFVARGIQRHPHR
jgi:hypothetical protein